MRSLLGLFGAVALLTIAACGDDDNPGKIPRTVPPVSTDGAAATAPVVKGVGPMIEAVAPIALFG